MDIERFLSSWKYGLVLSYCSLFQIKNPLVPSKLRYARDETQHEPPAKRKKLYKIKKSITKSILLQI